MSWNFRRELAARMRSELGLAQSKYCRSKHVAEKQATPFFAFLLSFSVVGLGNRCGTG
jgi:hypothetical protein